MTSANTRPQFRYRRLAACGAALLGAVLLTACQAPVPRTAHAGQAAAAAVIPACAADAKVMDGWDERAPPRHVFGNTWYVGSCGLSALLVTSAQGHVLIDGASVAAGPLIEANIRALGFDPADVKYLLNSHAHSDHAGGLAHLQRVTAAPLLARAPALAALRRGQGDRSDPQQLESGSAFPAIARVEPIADDGRVRVGSLVLTAYATPGHTPGGTSWSWRSCEGERCLDLAYTDSISALSDDQYRYLDHPGMVAAFRRGLETLAAMPCDLQITPHPLASDLFARLQGTAATALVDAGACRAYAVSGRANLARRLAAEAAADPH